MTSQQLAWARIKIYKDIVYTWGTLYSSTNASTKGFGTSSRLSQVGGVPAWWCGCKGAGAGRSGCRLV